eukprot:389547-Rhodomonas_salina.2
MQKSKQLMITIPKGVDNGSRLRIRQEGDAGPKGGPPGDLYVFLTVKPSTDGFKRDGADIYSNVGARTSAPARACGCGWVGGWVRVGRTLCEGWWGVGLAVCVQRRLCVADGMREEREQFARLLRACECEARCGLGCACERRTESRARHAEGCHTWWRVSQSSCVKGPACCCDCDGGWLWARKRHRKRDIEKQFETETDSVAAESER